MVASRCKSCGAGLSDQLTTLQRLSRLRPWQADQQVCEPCFLSISSQGNPDEPVSLLHADVRIPEALAERTPSRDFRTLLRRFYETAERALDEQEGIVTTTGGTTILALWSPRTGDADHARRALEAGNRLVDDLDSNWAVRRRIRAGVAVHTGTGTLTLTGKPGSHRFEVTGSAVTALEELAAGAPDNKLHASSAILAASEAD